MEDEERIIAKIQKLERELTQLQRYLTKGANKKTRYALEATEKMIEHKMKRLKELQRDYILIISNKN